MNTKTGISAARPSRWTSGALVLTLLATSAAVVFLTPGPAQAHYVYEYDYATDGNTCQRTRTEVSHGGGAGYVRTDGSSRSVASVWPLSCPIPHQVGPGYLKARWMLYKWNGSSWGFCVGSNYVSNINSASTVAASWEFGSGSAYCGTGAYANIGDSYHNAGTGNVGRSVSSGSHQLPA